MVRTQIYLTEQEHDALGAIAAASGRTQSDLIREAVDRYLVANDREVRLQLLRDGRGLWADREDLPDFEQLRRESERVG